MKSAEAAIKQILTDYFDGLYYSDELLLHQVFHPDAHYVTASDGIFIQLSMPEYFSIVSKRTSPAELRQTRQDEILSIDLIGTNTALAKVSCIIAPKHFTDLLSLIKSNGEWKIISKVFEYSIKN